jgi:NADH-quinone oxidoreductase subunit E
MDNDIEDILKKHEGDKNIISILQSIQNKYGYIPGDKAKEIAKKLNVPLVRLCGVATFYSQFKLHKPGKYIIQLCNGTACHVNNSTRLIEALKEELGIEEGETTKDGVFTFELVNCIGACAKSPTAAVNGKVYSNLTPKKLKKIIEEYKEQDKKNE